jgi:hypothetical protein
MEIASHKKCLRIGAFVAQSALIRSPALADQGCATAVGHSPPRWMAKNKKHAR